jgi:hypothetical protein
MPRAQALTNSSRPRREEKKKKKESRSSKWGESRRRAREKSCDECVLKQECGMTTKLKDADLFEEQVQEPDEAPAELQPRPATQPIISWPEHDGFDWASEDVVLEQQPKTAIYIDVRGCVVVRQERWYEDEDAIVIITRESLRTVIRRLQEIAEEEAGT